MGFTLWQRNYGLPSLRQRDIPNVRDVIELCNNIMPMLWSSEAICIMDLRAEVAQDDDSRLVGSVEQRANKKLEEFHILFVTDERRVRNGCMVYASVPNHLPWIIDVELQYHEVGVLGYMMPTTETKVP
jgi:hypothetical protein